MKITKERLKKFILEQTQTPEEENSPLIKWSYLLWAITQTTKKIPPVIKWLNLDIRDSSEVDEKAGLVSFHGESLSEEVQEYLQILQQLELKKARLKELFVKLEGARQ
jgi:hypothetical protein